MAEAPGSLVERRPEAAGGVEPDRLLRMDVHRGEGADESERALIFSRSGRKAARG